MKRFTETQKWEDPWFRRLSPEMKLLWQWLLDRCDNAGIIDPDLELASFQIGYQYPLDTLSGFGERIEMLPCGKWFIPKFIAFQYGMLSKDCKAHRPIFLSLQKHEVKGYPKGINTLQEKEKETVPETDKEKDQEKEPLDFPESPKHNPNRMATFKQVIEFAESQPMGIPRECSEAFFDRMEAEGWVTTSGLPLNDWRARFRSWSTNWINNQRKAK